MWKVTESTEGIHSDQRGLDIIWQGLIENSCMRKSPVIVYSSFGLQRAGLSPKNPPLPLNGVSNPGSILPWEAGAGVPWNVSQVLGSGCLSPSALDPEGNAAKQGGWCGRNRPAFSRPSHGCCRWKAMNSEFSIRTAHLLSERCLGHPAYCHARAIFHLFSDACS